MAKVEERLPPGSVLPLINYSEAVAKLAGRFRTNALRPDFVVQDTTRRWIEGLVVRGLGLQFLAVAAGMEREWDLLMRAGRSLHFEIDYQPADRALLVDGDAFLALIDSVGQAAETALAAAWSLAEDQEPPQG